MSGNHLYSHYAQKRPVWIHKQFALHLLQAGLYPFEAGS